MNGEEMLGVVLRVIRSLGDLGISYEVGGSFAVALVGVPRSSRDADLVIDIRPEQVADLAAELEGDFYLEAAAMETSVRQGRSFNIIHKATFWKVDLFPVRPEPYWRMEFSRRLQIPLPGHPEQQIWSTSPEDVILKKLWWYRQGGEVSERQWTDVLEVLRIQQGVLDRAYLDRWAAILMIPDLLGRALQTAGT